MKTRDPLADVSTHFAFGENWKSYSETIDEDRIKAAVDNMSRLLARKSLEGYSFLDIGCGSGIHSLAALRLGARKVVALDIDPICVETCKKVLSKWATSSNWECRVASVFDLPPEWKEKFDLVYSWGVLHHTGDMWSAVAAAAALVTEKKGMVALALYRKTRLCRVWKAEKRIYSKLPSVLQLPLLTLYSAANLLRLALRGENPISHVKNYQRKRGMSYWHDDHDWLGGYPYESASPEEVTNFMAGFGFQLCESFIPKESWGLTGASCAEYIFSRG